MADRSVGDAIFKSLLDRWPGDVVAVVTTNEGTIFQRAKDHSIPAVVYSGDQSLVEFLERYQASPDLGLLAWWPRIVSPRLLKVASHGFVNTHPSLLPYNRGKHYNFWAIVEGSPFGVTLHKVDAGVDTGPIIAQREISYGWEATGETLYNEASRQMIDLVVEEYPRLRALDFEGKPQQTDGRGSFHRASELEPASQIDLDRSYPARELLDLLRARTFPPHPGCWFVDDGDTYEVRIQISKRQS